MLYIYNGRFSLLIILNRDLRDIGMFEITWHLVSYSFVLTWINKMNANIYTEKGLKMMTSIHIYLII